MIYTDLWVHFSECPAKCLKRGDRAGHLNALDGCLSCGSLGSEALFPVGIVMRKKLIDMLWGNKLFVHKTKPKPFNYISLTHRWVKWINDFEVSSLAFLSATAIVGDDFSFEHLGMTRLKLEAVGQVGNLADPPKVIWILYTWCFRNWELLPKFPE